MQIKPLLASLVITASIVPGRAELTDADLKLPITPGQFAGTLESLTNYSCPDWFRDAKFGIWAHWGPQAVPMEGDWYAKKMYQQETVDRKTGKTNGPSADYIHHLATYEHPSTNGWKDIIPLWKAEKWEPEKLMELYKKAGAKYFVSMGTHHDNFFLWNSKLHRWNSVLMGPHRDVVGEWQAAAKKNGLPFGVSEHLGASFTWFQEAHKADKTGPFAGVPYDGASSNNWDLYHFPAEPGDNGWYSKNPRWHQQWYNEVKELVDNYKPDLLYSDGGVAFGASNVVGLSQIANLYNISAKAHGGKSEAVYNCKQISGGRWVQDYERGVGAKIDPYPWQCDTSIGDWFYNKHWKYQPVNWTVTLLVDIVSNNGNLLLNVVLRPDGTLDPEAEAMLHQLAEWTAVNGEAIYGSRPWLVSGEGPVRMKGGAFNEKFNFTARDIRFTTKGKTLYATTLGWPAENQILIRSLARTEDASQNQIKRVELLGHKGELKFNRTQDGLIVTLPASATNGLTCTLRITGSDLKPAPLPESANAAVLILPDIKGSLTFGADEAELHGQKIKVETKGGKSNIGFWNNANEWASWHARISKPGKYKITTTLAVANSKAEFLVEVGGEKISATVPTTSGWDKYATTEIGTVTIKQAGDFTLKVLAKDAASWKPINLSSVRLEPVAQ